MDLMLIFCLTLSMAFATETYRRPCAPRRYFLTDKIRNISDDVSELKQEINGCCEKKDCMYAGKTYTHGSIFAKTDGCNMCVCNHGLVTCTNATGCAQNTDQTTDGLGYNYKDEVAQSFCSTKGTTLPKPTSLKHISAVRRNCDDPAEPTCDVLCGSSTILADLDSNFPSIYWDWRVCDGALWFWMDHPRLGQASPGSLNMVTISYDAASGCGATGCGPNYCCCVAYTD